MAGERTPGLGFAFALLTPPTNEHRYFFVRKSPPLLRGAHYLGGGTFPAIGVLIREGVFSLRKNNHPFEESFSQFFMVAIHLYALRWCFCQIPAI